MANGFKLKVYTPGGVLFEDNISQASIHTDEGWIGLLANHAPLIGSFEDSHFYARDLENNQVDTIVGAGIFEFNNNVLSLFTNFFALATEINENAFDRIEKELNNAIEKQKTTISDSTMNAISLQLKKNLNHLKEITAKK